MSNSSGRENGSPERPPLGTVRCLRVEEQLSRSSIAEEDWYETERLTGQITGGSRRATTAEEPALADEPIVALDWRDALPSGPPSKSHRFRRSLRRREGPKRAASWLRAKMRSTDTGVLEREAPLSLPEPDGSAAACAKADVSRAPVLELRHGYPDATAARSAWARISEGAVSALRRGRAARVAALTLAAAAAAVVAIASALGGAGTHPRRPALLASASAPGSASGAGASATAMGIAGHHFRVQASVSDGAADHAGRRVTPHHSGPSGRHPTASPVRATTPSAPSQSAPASQGGTPYSPPQGGGSSSPPQGGGSYSPPQGGGSYSPPAGGSSPKGSAASSHQAGPTGPVSLFAAGTSPSS